MKKDYPPDSASFGRQCEDPEREEEWFYAMVTGDTEPDAPVVTFPLLAASAIYAAVAGVAQAFRSQNWTSCMKGEKDGRQRDESDVPFRPAFARIIDGQQRLVVGIQLAPVFLVLMPAFSEEETERIRQHQRMLAAEIAHMLQIPQGEMIASYLRRQSAMIGLHLVDKHYRHHHEMKALKSFISAGGTLEWFTLAEKHNLN